MIRPLALACAAAAALIPFSAQAAGATIDRSGGTTVIDQRDTQAPLVGVGVYVAAGLNRQTLAQNGTAALTAETILRTPVAIAGAAPVALEDAVAAHGGSIKMSVDAQGVRFYAESLPEDAGLVTAAFAQALAHPDFSGATLVSARSSLAQRLGELDKIPFDVGLAMLDHAGTGRADAGFAPLGNAAAIANRMPADVRSFYSTYYVRGGVVVSAVGRTDALPPGTLQQLATLLRTGQTAPVKTTLPSLDGSSHSLIAHRDIAAPWLLARYNAPSYTSKDFGPMLVLTAFVQKALADIAEVPGSVTPTSVSRSIGALYQYDRNGGSLTVYVNGSIGSPNRAFATALSLVGVLAATKLEGNIDNFKATAYGDFVSNATSLESRAWLAALFAQNGASDDYLDAAMSAIGSTRTSDIQRVAKAYLNEPTIALVLPRAGAQPQP